jgi:glycine/D-amino acid oxidase-like deaminating enzyme
MRHRCVVVGAGIVGSALAARLSELGGTVTVVEANQPGQGTSRSSLAWVNANDKPPRAYHDLNVAGLHAWREWADRLGGDWFRPGGSLHWTGPGGAEQLARHVASLTAWGYPAELLTPARARQLEPGLALPGDVGAAAHFPEEAYLVTGSVIPLLLRYAAERGASLVTGDAVAHLLVTGGRVRGVRLASGSEIEADAVALCAGWRTPSLAAQVGADVPLVPIDAPGSPAPCLVAYTQPSLAGLSRLLVAPGLCLRPDGGGRLYLEAIDANDAVDLTTTAARLLVLATTLLKRARTILPALGRAGLAEHRVCVRPLPADGFTIAGRPGGVEGCYVIVTHSGVTLAAHLARLAAAEIVTGRDQPELASYRLDRFAAGSPAAGDHHAHVHR